MSAEAPSMTPSFSVDTAFSAAAGIEDIAPSFENFSPNLNSILESDRYIPGELVRDFTTKLVSWAPAPDTVHLPGHVHPRGGGQAEQHAFHLGGGPGVDSHLLIPTCDSHLGGGLGRPPREVIHLRDGVTTADTFEVKSKMSHQEDTSKVEFGGVVEETSLPVISNVSERSQYLNQEISLRQMPDRNDNRESAATQVVDHAGMKKLQV